jgi:hypothetical protein
MDDCGIAALLLVLIGVDRVCEAPPDQAYIISVCARRSLGGAPVSVFRFWNGWISCR